MKKQNVEKISSQISFTFDTWTSKNQISFLGITMHWIDDNWILHHMMLDFCQLSGSHSGENMAMEFLNILKKYNILKKVMLTSNLFSFKY